MVKVRCLIIDLKTFMCKNVILNYVKKNDNSAHFSAPAVHFQKIVSL